MFPRDSCRVCDLKNSNEAVYCQKKPFPDQFILWDDFFSSYENVKNIQIQTGLSCLDTSLWLVSSTVDKQ